MPLVAVREKLISPSAKNADLRSCLAKAYWDRTDNMDDCLVGACLICGLVIVRWVPSLFLSCIGVGWRWRGS